MENVLTFQPLRPWLTHPRETLAGAILAGVGLVVLAGTSVASPLLPQFAKQVDFEQAAALDKPLPNQIRDLAPETALDVNAHIPIASGPNPAALPFTFGKSSAETRARALECMTSAIYYEAAQEPTDGQRGVAQVILNRVRHPAFPNSVCGVVYEGSTRTTGCQFTFTCDGSMRFAPIPSLWNRARKVAEAALNGSVYAPVGYATHYHANYVVPYWASSLTKTAVEGAHIFYRWAGGWGQPAAFAKAYAGHEPSARALRTAALAVPHVAPQGAVAAAIEDIPGAEAIKLAPSMRGDKRIAVRFNLAARKASDEAPHEEYSKKFDASDNLKWALSGDTSASNEKPLGTTSKPAVPPATAPAAPAPVAAGER